MNKEQFLEYMKEVSNKVNLTLEKKNSKYSGVAEDPFRNFKRGSRRVSVEDGIYNRMMDKISRIETLLEPEMLHEENEESVFDSIEDAIGYALILHAWLANQYFSDKDTIDAELNRDYRSINVKYPIDWKLKANPEKPRDNFD